MKIEANHLFVYGTLMSCFNNEMSRFLRNSCELIGHGRFRGKLYDLGTYPGAIYDLHSNNLVEGEVYSVTHDSDKLFQRLDHYEGISEVLVDEYQRIIVPIKADEMILPCWVYTLKQLPKNNMTIQASNYWEYLQGK